MNINDIKDPKFLKGLSIKELESLSKDIRTFLLESVSKTGGHLSSNLGVVELTVALHYVFNAPEDKIFFDVGHQCYTHKILTGRADKMSTLRQFEGISGFQKRNESIYDCFEAGHSSTALSAALGMAVARDLDCDDYNIIPIVGDASISNGLSLEALNNIGYEKKKVIIVFNDNNMSISKNVGALTHGFSNLRNSKPYNDLKDDVKTFLKDKTYGSTVIKGIRTLKSTIKNTVVDSGIFKEFNIDYLGPVDGHNIEELIRAFEVAKEKEGPVVVHCVTKKGKGYSFTEDDNVGKWHGVGKFDLNTKVSLSSTPSGYKSYSKHVADTVEAIMKEDNRVIAITPAMITGSALESIFAKFPRRSFDVGIAEEHAVEFACGLALNGKRPFVSVYSSFLQRAYDEMNHDVCRMNLPVVIGIDRAGIVGEDGDTHHGVFDISILNPLPNLVLCEGKDANEIVDLINSAFDQDSPFCIRYPRGNVKVDPGHKKQKIETGTWEMIVEPKEGCKAVIMSYGNDVCLLEEVIRNNSLPYALVNCRFIKPLDKMMLDQIADLNKPVFVYTTDMIKGGLGESIMQYYSEKGRQIRINNCGIDDVFVPHGSVKQLKELLGIDINTFLKNVEKELND